LGAIETVEIIKELIEIGPNEVCDRISQMEGMEKSLGG